MAYGYNIQGLFRDYMVANANLPIDKAQAIADAVANDLRGADWLELADGTHFNKAKKPASRSICIQGNLAEGFTFYGPFEDFDAASEWSENHTVGQDWIATLWNPGQEV